PALLGDIDHGDDARGVAVDGLAVVGVAVIVIDLVEIIDRRHRAPVAPAGRRGGGDLVELRSGGRVGVVEVDDPQAASGTVGQIGRLAGKFVEVAEHVVGAALLVGAEGAVDAEQVGARGIDRAFAHGIAVFVQHLAADRVDHDREPVAYTGVDIDLPDQPGDAQAVDPDRLAADRLAKARQPGHGGGD